MLGGRPGASIRAEKRRELGERSAPLLGLFTRSSLASVRRRFQSSRFACLHNKLARPAMRVSTGLAVKRPKLKSSTVKKGHFYRQPSKNVITCHHAALRSFKYHFFSCSSRTAGFQRIVLTGTTSSHVPKYTHFTVFITDLCPN